MNTKSHIQKDRVLKYIPHILFLITIIFISSQDRNISYAAYSCGSDYSCTCYEPEYRCDAAGVGCIELSGGRLQCPDFPYVDSVCRNNSSSSCSGEAVYESAGGICYWHYFNCPNYDCDIWNSGGGGGIPPTTEPGQQNWQPECDSPHIFPSSAIAGQQLTLTGNAHDPNGDGIDYLFWRSSAPGFPFTPGMGTFVEDAPGEAGEDTPIVYWTPANVTSNTNVDVSFQANDNRGGATWCSGTVLVSPSGPGNRFPVCSGISGPGTVHIGSVSQYTANASDPDGNSLSYSWNAPSGSFTPNNTRSVNWTAPANVGSVELTSTVSDGNGGTVVCRKTVNVITNNNSPICTSISGPGTVHIGSVSQYTANASDPDGDNLTYSWSAPSGTFNPNNQRIVNWTAPITTGTVVLTANISDGRGGTTSCTRSVNVRNLLPSCSISGPSSVDERSVTNFTASGSDPTGGTLSFTWSASPLAGLFYPYQGQSVNWTAPNVTSNQSNTINVDVSSTSGFQNNCTKPITIIEVNRPPECGQIGGPTEVYAPGDGEENRVSYFVKNPIDESQKGCTDPDGDTLTYSWNLNPPDTGGIFSGSGFTADWSVSSTVSADQRTVRVTVSDGKGGSVSRSLLVTVIPSFSVTANVSLSDESCDFNFTNPAENAQVQVYRIQNGASTLITEGNTDGQGRWVSGRISRVADKEISVCASYTHEDLSQCDSYSVTCHRIGNTVGNGNCTLPQTVPTSDNMEVDFSARPNDEESWYTSIDGGIVVPQMIASLPCTGADIPVSNGFTSNMINNQSNVFDPLHKYYLFTSAQRFRSADDPPVVEGDNGGYAQNLNHTYEYLMSKYSFRPDFGGGREVTEITDFSKEFDPKNVGVYKMSIENFNSLVSKSSISYDLTENGTAILYVYGPDNMVEPTTMDIRKAIQHKDIRNDNEKLLIVTDSPVQVSSAVGYNVRLGPTYSVTGNPNISTPILSTKDITIIGGVDSPVYQQQLGIILQGPLVTRKEIFFQRDLGALFNGRLPSEAIRYFPSIVYELTQMERSHSDIKAFTGFGIYDLQWQVED